MKRLAILGASGHGKVIADIAELRCWDEIVFFDDAWPDKTIIGVWAIAGNTDTLLAQLATFDGCVVAIGNNKIRWEKHQKLVAAGAKLTTVIHPAAVVSRHTVIGDGSVVMANAVINIDTCIGQAAIINTAATVDHDCRLGHAVHLSPGVNLAGGVCIGDSTWLGINSSVKQLIGIGSDVVVGAGAVVVKDVEDGLVVLGTPARSR